jgi:hypothetical protein
MSDLSRTEFTDAISKGLGRALIHVKAHGLDLVKDLVLNACLHNLSYDPQIEHSRAKWLLAMFADSSHYQEFRDAILAEMSVVSSNWDLLQLCELAREMAWAGDPIAADRLADFVYEQATTPVLENWAGANQLVQLSGLDAVLKLAKIYGARLLANPDDWIPELDIFTEQRTEIIEMFDRYAATEESISVYYQYLIDQEVFVITEDLQSTQPPRSSQLLIATIIDRAQHKEQQYPSIYAGFGYRATAIELDTIFNLLLSEPDEEICLRLLWVFTRASLPSLADRLFDWANSEDKRLRTAAIQALAQTSADRVYQLGRSKLAARQLTGADIKTINLFINNYHSGDAELILTGLNEVEIDPDDLLMIGCSIIKLSQQQSDLEAAILLMWMYDRTPCSCCRERAMTQLEKDRQLSDILLAEYRYDATQWLNN